MAQSQPSLEKELALQKRGFQLVAGIDEAGRGAWAGPVVAAAVILPLDNARLPVLLDGVRDSKKMTARQRDTLFTEIQTHAAAIGVGIGSHTCIDRHRIIAATRHAMHQAVHRLGTPPQFLLIDALKLPDISVPQEAFYKADAISLSVAAASIIAKVSRDRLMVLLDERYPSYGFARHKGYGTRLHRQALTQLGPCRIHRYSFAPVAEIAASDSANP